MAAPKPDGTRQSAAEIAEYVCRYYAAGYRGTLSIAGIHFELTDVARCSEFVREATECAAGTGPHSMVYWGPDARETEQRLLYHSKRTAEPDRGDIVCFNHNAGTFGHIGIALGDGKFAENTSSTTRGPGFVISRLSEMTSRISGYYSVLPSRVSALAPHDPPLLVTLDSARQVEGRMLDGKLWTPTRETVKLCGRGLVWYPEQGKAYLVAEEASK